MSPLSGTVSVPGILSTTKTLPLCRVERSDYPLSLLECMSSQETVDLPTHPGVVTETVTSGVVMGTPPLHVNVLLERLVVYVPHIVLESSAVSLCLCHRLPGRHGGRGDKRF